MSQTEHHDHRVGFRLVIVITVALALVGASSVYKFITNEVFAPDVEEDVTADPGHSGDDRLPVSDLQ